MKDYTIWCTYHRKDIPKEYNLYETEHFKLFYNDNFSLQEDNINYLHDYLCELVTYYYVWKNNLKSDIIGFCQYSKHIMIDYDKLEKFGFYTPFFCYTETSIYTDINSDNNICNNLNYLNRTLIFYIKDKYGINIFEYYKNHKYIYESWNIIYLFKWDIFCDLCDYIFGFFEYIFTNEKWKIKSNIDFLVKVNSNIIDEIYSNQCWSPKDLAVFFEYAVGLYMGIKYNLNENIDYGINSIKKYFISCKNVFDNFNDFNTWFKYNIKTGIFTYVIKSNDELIENEINKNLNIQYNIWVCKNDNEYEKIKNKLKGYNEEIIELNSNERIHCDNGIEFYNGNYYIETY